MPVVPTVPQSDAGVSGPSVSGISREAFGVGIGRSLEEMGQTIERSSDKIFDRAMALKQEQNQDEVAQLESQWILKSGLLKEGFEAKQGYDRVNALPQFMKDTNKLREEIGQSASNPWVRSHMNGFLLRNANYLIAHGAGQSAAAQRQATRETLNTQSDAIDAQVQSWSGDGDVNLLDEAYGQKWKIISRQTAVEGLPSEVAIERFKREKEKLSAMFVAGWAEKDPAAAKAWMDDNKGSFGAATNRLMEQVNQKNRDVVVRNVAAQHTQDLGTEDDMEFEEKTTHERDQAARKQVEALLPGDEKAKEQVSQRVQAIISRDKSQQREQNQQDYQSVVEVASGVGVPGGKKPTNIDEFNLMATPEQRKAYESLKPTQKRQIQTAFKVNSKDPVVNTPEREATFEHLWGMSGTGETGDPKKFMEQDLWGADITQKQRDQLFNRRKAIINGKEGDPRVGHALAVLRPELYAAGALREQNEDKFYRFTGALERMMASQEADAKKPMKMEEIKQMGSRLLQTQITEPGRFFGTNNRKIIDATVPEEFTKAVTDEYVIKNGFPPDAKTVNSMYLIYLYNKNYKKAAPSAPDSK